MKRRSFLEALVAAPACVAGGMATRLGAAMQEGQARSSRAAQQRATMPPVTHPARPPYPKDMHVECQPYTPALDETTRPPRRTAKGSYLHI